MSTLRRVWEEVDHDLDDSIAGALTSPTGSDGEGDPLGLGAIIKWVAVYRVEHWLVESPCNQREGHGHGI